MTENIDLTASIFHTEEAARSYFETQRWPSVPTARTADRSA